MRAVKLRKVMLSAGSDAKRLRIGEPPVIFAEIENSLIVAKVGPRGSVYD
jgi:hypothetical protein